MRFLKRRCALLSVSLFVLGLLLSPLLHADETFSLSDISRAQARTEVMRSAVTSPHSRYVAWVEEGNLRVALEPDFRPSTLVTHGAGEPITALYASGDGIFYMRGTYRPALGAIAARDTRELWRIDVPSGTPQLVASGTDLPCVTRVLRFVTCALPALSFAPDGKALAFAEGNVLYEIRHSDNGGWKRRQLLQPDADAQHLMATGIEDIVYSPDGTRIAIVSARRARQSYVAIHDIGRNETRYLDPSIFRDSAPAWSPDGTEVAFVREPGNWTLTYRFTPRREGAPWSIMVANADSGKVRTVWTAERGPGSVARTFAPIWTVDGRILFSWEKTGWNLIYAVPADGGQATLLTPGEGEVSDPVLSPDGRVLVYEANVRDLARRHPWTLDLEGGDPPKALTVGTGVERSPQFTAGGYLAYRAMYRECGEPKLMIRPPHGQPFALAVHSPEAAKRRQRLWQQFQPEKPVSVRAEDGLVSWHILIQPATPPPADGYPVVVDVHGGPTTQTLPGGDLFGQYLVSRGYLFVDMNYRGSTGFGLDYRLPEGRGATGGSEVKDLAALAQYLTQRGDVNPRRIGIIGGSYGGHLVGLAMSRLPNYYAAGVSMDGVADWVVEMEKDQEDQGWMSAPPPYMRLSERMRIEELAHESSSTSHVDDWRGPVLLTTGELDRAGHIESVIDLGYRLLERGVPVEFHVDPAGGHHTKPLQRIVDFFDRHLKGVSGEEHGMNDTRTEP